MKSTESKFRTVIDQNTFYFSDRVFEEGYEGHLSSVKETLLVLKNSVENSSLRTELIEELLQKENGLTALLALTGFSKESLKQLITVIRVVDDSELSKLVLKDEWCPDEPPMNITAWGDEQIAKMIVHNEHFRKGIANIFFEGATVPLLARILPLFELKKLSISKLKFEVPAASATRPSSPEASLNAFSASVTSLASAISLIVKVGLGGRSRWIGAVAGGIVTSDG